MRDWLHVSDHCRAIELILERGRVGDVYNVGGGAEVENLRLIHSLCDVAEQAFNTRPELRRLYPHSPRSARDLIHFVTDRPGHDRRYAIDASKIERELGWKPAETFETGIQKTIAWYLDNPEWVAHVQSGAYRQWVQTQYAGTAEA